MHEPNRFGAGRSELDAAPAAPLTPAVGLAPLLLCAAAASLAAGLVHAAAAGTHAGAEGLVRLFAVTAVAQVGWAALVALRSSALVVTTGALLNGAVVGAWALSRTRGLPWPADLVGVEDVGTQDTIAAALGAGAAIAAVLALARPSLRTPRTGPMPGMALLAGAAALALAVPGMTAAHAHTGSHDHDHGGDEVAADHAAGVGADHPHEDPAMATGPVISLDDTRVTDAQRRAAQSLIDSSTTAMADYADPASVEAAGYLSIGDGVTGFEHFVNYGFLTDGIDLDPSRVESIVFSVAADGTRELVSAMYILGPGSTMADVPDVAGELTTWHDHQNLCWEGARVVGTTDATGSCERGVFQSTPPMLHVWMVPNPCGPFAGLEGHGDDCGTHSH